MTIHEKMFSNRFFDTFSSLVAISNDPFGIDAISCNVGWLFSHSYIVYAI